MTNSVNMDYVESFHPGSALNDLIAIHDRDLESVSESTGVSLDRVKALSRLEIAIDDEMAVALGAEFNRPADFWRNLQLTYQRELAKEEALESVADEVALLGRFKSKEAAALGWLPASRDKRELVLFTRRFLDVPTLKGYTLGRGGGRRRYRITGARDGYAPEALGMWLRQGEIEAGRRTKVPEFDAGKFRENLLEIRKLTMRSPFAFLPALSELCAEAGVIFLVVEDLPTAGAKGATCWRYDGTPYIQINFKGNWLDGFWFTFFHEAAHVLQGNRNLNGRGQTEPVIHVDGDSDRERQRELNRELELKARTEDEVLDEREADETAGELLIPQQAWSAVIASDKPSVARVKGYSERLGIHPGIIVGRLQKEGFVGWGDARFNRLKTKVTMTERQALSRTNIGH